jgi:hypothetical protein
MPEIRIGVGLQSQKQLCILRFASRTCAPSYPFTSGVTVKMKSLAVVTAWMLLIFITNASFFSAAGH